MFKYLLVLFGLLACVANASEKTRVINSLQSESNSLESNGKGLTEEEKSLAKKWMLSESDWTKYKEIMKGPRGIWSPGIDPLTALGVSATNESERKRYAEIWMRVETQKIELELAFEVARMEAAKRLHGDKKLIDNDSWIEAWRKKHTDVKKKVSVFMDVDCKEECSEIYSNVTNSINKNDVLDIYFKSGATAESIASWASFMGVDPEIVKSRKITLNFDKGTSKQMGVSMYELPAVKVLDVQTGTVSTAFSNNEASLR